MSSKISGNPPLPPHSRKINNTKNVNIFDANIFDVGAYAYHLPQALIAEHPLKERDQARLMVINRHQQTIDHDIFKNIGKYLPAKSALVVNDSKVIAARLLGIKLSTGAKVEIFLLKQLDDFHFEALLKPLKRIKEHDPIDLGQGINVCLVNRESRTVKFNKPNILTVLENIGHIPLPPYIKRQDNADDKVLYQNVYANKLGSVASATAGLHFTQELIDELKAKGHPFLSTTLHIGYGTFKPVEVADIRQHPMHHESYELFSDVYAKLDRFKKDGMPIVAVGTTSCRVLESVALNGVLKGSTNIFIYPGFSFKMVDVLITNFHLPQSTLLMLVSAFGGYDLIKRAYEEAIRAKYRFYSYGDAMIII